MTKKALGRGLGTLIPGVGGHESGVSESVTEIEISRILPNKYQPRQVFEDVTLKELADSIRANGVIQPVLVRRLENGVYELIAGERRWRASQIVGLRKIPALIKDVSDEKSLEIALIENLQRENLNPVEAAQGYQRLIKDFNLTQEEIAARVGKERTTITNYLRLLALPEKIKDYISRSIITMGHAKAILSVSAKNEQLRFAEYLVKKGASVREAELWSKRWGAKAQRGKKRIIEGKDAVLKDVESRLQRIFGTKVRIYNEKKGGKIVVDYYSPDDLTRILEIVEK